MVSQSLEYMCDHCLQNQFTASMTEKYQQDVRQVRTTFKPIFALLFCAFPEVISSKLQELGGVVREVQALCHAGMAFHVCKALSCPTDDRLRDTDYKFHECH